LIVRFAVRLVIALLVIVEVIDELATLTRRFRRSVTNAWDKAAAHERNRAISDEIRWLTHLGADGRASNGDASSSHDSDRVAAGR
jgi:hypothetical protein